ncbi:histidine kinase N-terminal 7TM domain-containing protein [Haloarcula onubensis]|uniref:histidine kinase n=1 Tax=Haloarcula onubensis TaxID=2950539 RepID=A0ABU2FP89_9EURY|nr:histidine kinase N-terminal 7TM domain-containing protein [Halomicroarcula sp. S3CR25-11]MDS0282564.1 ATP-binding protein [Halomicroarcula sp. S3CR25-11]
MVSVTPVEAALVAFFFVSGLALAGLALYLRASQLPNRGIRSFLSLLVLMAVWSFSAVAKLTLPPFVERFLVALELPMGVVFAFLFLVFASQYTGRRWHRQQAFTAYVVVSLLALSIGLLTNPVHGLFWERITLSTAVFSHYVHEGLGPLYFFYVGLAYCHFAAGVYALVNLHLRSRYNTTPMMLVTTGASVPLLVNLVSVFDRAPIPGLDYTPVGLAVFGAATTVSMQLDLFDIIPVARDTAVEQSSEGMVILDSKRRVRDYNPTAAALLPALSSHRGAHVDTVVDDVADLFDTSTQTTIAAADGEETTYLSVQLSPITDGPHHLGWTMVLSDVTEQQRRERHLQLVSRVLRHNMANRINTIMGHVELLDRRADDRDQPHLDAIDASATSIIETSGKLRTIQDIVTGGRPARPTDVSRTVAAVADRYADRYPEASVTTDCPDGVFAQCPTGFQAALSNLVENGIEHNPDPSPSVSVTVTVSGTLVHVSVADDGAGIPETERRILEDGETPLRHSAGVGLWLVYCFVEQAGHELSFERSDAGGSVVAFALDRARSSFETDPNA